MIIFDENGQYQEEYLAFMRGKILPKTREIFAEMRLYLEENQATGLDYRLMLEFILEDLELNQMALLLKWQGEHLRKNSDK